MKAKLELTENELKRFVGKRRFDMNIKFPDKTRPLYYIIIVLILTTVISGFLFYSLGDRNGQRYGFVKGYDAGEQACLKDNYKHMTLNQALGYHVKYNLGGIFSWFALVVGIAWVIHGVGFHIVR